MQKTIERKSKLSYDGRNLMTRIPKDISEEAKLEKGDNLIWKAKGKTLEVEVRCREK